MAGEKEVVETLEADALESEGKDEQIPDDVRQQIITEYREELARKIGWKPKREFSGKDWADNEKEWVDAETFILRTPTVGHTTKLQKELRDVKTALEYLKTHEDQRTKKEIDRLNAELEESRKQAIFNSDYDEVKRIESEITNLKPEDEVKSLDEEVVEDWIDNNSWYDENSKDFNPKLRKIADGIYEMNRLNKVSLKRTLKEIDETMADLIKKPEIKPTRNPVEGGQGRSSSSSQHKVTFNELTDEEKTVCKVSVSNGWFKNNQDWIDSYIKEIGDKR